MSFEPVDFFVTDKTPMALPVSGVLVKIYNAAGSVFFTQATTDTNGQASFLLETQSYSARFFKQHVSFAQPQLFDVLAAPDENKFDTKAEVLVMPVATDPRLCRASGFFRNLNGAPKQWLDIHFNAHFAPILLEGDAIFTERVEIRTDADGYACIDLIRCAQYDAIIENLEDTARVVSVPDASSVNLPDLLLPVVGSVMFDPPGPYALTIGTDLVVTPTVMTSDGRPLEGVAPYDVQWSTSDPLVAMVLPTATTLVLRGLAAGTTELKATRANQTIIRIPNTPIQGQPVAITVT